MLGVDKQPIHVPLGYTIADLEDILAPGVYRLDIVDAKGEPLDFTVAIELGQYRNAGAPIEIDEPEVSGVQPMLPATVSDTRFVLEANVRATQMAFNTTRRRWSSGFGWPRRFAMA